MSTSKDILTRGLISVHQRDVREDGLATLTLRIKGFEEALQVSRRGRERSEWFEDLGNHLAFSIVSLMLSPLRRKYPRTFILTNEETELNGVRYGEPPKVFGAEDLLRDLPNVGIPVIYDKLGNFKSNPSSPSLLVDVKNLDLVNFLPLLVGDMMMPVTYAFILLPNDRDLSKVSQVASEATSRHHFETSLLRNGGAIYWWFEEPYFQILLRSEDVSLVT